MDEREKEWEARGKREKARKREGDWGAGRHLDNAGLHEEIGRKGAGGRREGKRKREGEGEGREGGYQQREDILITLEWDGRRREERKRGNGKD